jgi:FixJ family two-component response regulator
MNASGDVTPDMRPVAAPTVYVVDDDDSIRRLMTWLFETDGVRVEAFATAETFLDAYAPGNPGCLVLDLTLAGMDGLKLQRLLKARGFDLPVVFVSGTAEVTQAVEAVKEGAVDFVVKPFDYRQLVAIVRRCLQRNVEAREQQRSTRAAAGSLASLTPREREVMNCVIAGKLNRMIADELNVSIKTVEAHRARVMEKLQVHSVAELVRLSLMAGQTIAIFLGFTLIVEFGDGP